MRRLYFDWLTYNARTGSLSIHYMPYTTQKSTCTGKSVSENVKCWEMWLKANVAYLIAALPTTLNIVCSNLDDESIISNYKTCCAIISKWMSKYNDDDDDEWVSK